MIRHFAVESGGRHQVDRRGRNGGEIRTVTETGRQKFVLATENGAGKVFNGNFQGERGEVKKGSQVITATPHHSNHILDIKLRHSDCVLSDIWSI